MDFIDLDEDTINTEVLGSFSVRMDVIFIRYLQSSCSPRDHCQSAHRHWGRHWWFGQAQVGAAGDCSTPSTTLRSLSIMVCYRQRMYCSMVLWVLVRPCSPRPSPTICNANFISIDVTSPLRIRGTRSFHPRFLVEMSAYHVSLIIVGQ